MRLFPIAAIVALAVSSIGAGTGRAEEYYPEFNMGMVGSSPLQVQYRCPGQPVVWLDLGKGRMFYHAPGHYKANMGWGWYVCLRDIPSINVHFRNTGAPLARPAPNEGLAASSAGVAPPQAKEYYPEFNSGMYGSSPLQVQYRCPGQPVVWLDLGKGRMFYHMPGHYKANMGWGWYVCLRDIPSINVHFRNTGAPLARPAPNE